VYQYDEVGNLLSITTGTTTANPPVIQSLIPEVLFIGTTTQIIITGQNFLTMNKIIADNPLLQIKTLSITDTEINANILIPATISPGPVTLTITNLYGSANIQTSLTSSKLTFSPGQIAITPGSAGNITVSITPSLGIDVTVQITNNNLAAVSAPATVLIPASGAITFTINAISEGAALIESGNAKSVVFVTKPFTPEPGEVILNNAGPISVVIDQPVQVWSSFGSGPVSASIDQPGVLSTSIESGCVSTSIESPAGNSTITSAIISVKISP